MAENLGIDILHQFLFLFLFGLFDSQRLTELLAGVQMLILVSCTGLLHDIGHVHKNISSAAVDLNVFYS